MNDLDKRKKKYSEKMIEFNLEDIPKELADCTWGIKEEKTDADILMQKYLEKMEEFYATPTYIKIQEDGEILYSFPLDKLNVKLQDNNGNTIATNFTESTLEDVTPNNLVATNDEISLDNQITTKMNETRTKEQVVFNIVSPQYNIDDQLVFEIDYFTKNGTFELQRLGTDTVIKDYSLDKVLREFYGDFSDYIISVLKVSILSEIDMVLQHKTDKLAKKLDTDISTLLDRWSISDKDLNSSSFIVKKVHYQSTTNIYY